jgi:hypothetical protein
MIAPLASKSAREGDQLVSYYSLSSCQPPMAEIAFLISPTESSRLLGLGRRNENGDWG